MGEQREDQDGKNAEETDHGDKRQIAMLAVDRQRDVPGHPEAPRRLRFGEPKRHERDKDERIRERRAERVEVAQETEGTRALKIRDDQNDDRDRYKEHDRAHRGSGAQASGL